MHNVIYVTGVYSKEIMNMFFVGQVSGFVKNFVTWIYSDNINVINVKLCLMVRLIEVYLFIPFSVTLTTFQDHTNIENFNRKFRVLIQIG